MAKFYILFTLKDGNYGVAGAYSNKTAAQKAETQLKKEGYKVITDWVEPNVYTGRKLNNSYYGWDYKNNFEKVELKVKY
jgi:hypothetical protein